MSYEEMEIDESFRLKDLSNYSIVLDQPEAVFSDLANLATHITNSPLGGVSVVDDRHVWLKGRVGVDIKCLDREGAFCAYAVTSNEELFIVPDASKDPRFADNPLVANAPFIRYYAAAAMISQQGYSLGTLWIMDTKPRDTSEFDQTVLRGLANQAMKVFEFAHRNPCTGLPNRSAFVADMQRRLNEARTPAMAEEDPAGGPADQGVFGYIQPQNLHLIHSAYGREIGETVLNAFSDVLRSWAKDTVRLAHLDGDAFGFAMLCHPTEIELKLKEVQELVANLIPVGASLYRLQCTVGVSHFPQSGANASSLLDQAAAASTAVPERSPNSMRTFAASQAADTVQLMEFQRDFNRYTQEARLISYYQPQVDMTHGRVIGLEALLRLRHPKRGIVGPGVLLPLAEQSGLMPQLDQYVLETVCHDIKTWREAGISMMPVAVNLSRTTLADPDTPQMIHRKLQKYGVNPKLIEIEITEAGLWDDSSNLQARVQELHDLGIAVSIDDFGTGLSNLSTLRALKFERLKADRLYVHGASTNHHVGGILRFLHEISELFSVELVCEGVEDEQDLSWAISIGCTIFQGWFFARALDPESTTRMLRQHTQFAKGGQRSPFEVAGFLRSFEGRDGN